jgi:hypothetical protein
MTAPKRRRAAPVTTRKAAPKVKAVPPPPEPVKVGIEQAIEQMTPEFVACRDYGHSWKPFTATWNPTFRYYESQLKCQRCNTVRTRFIGPQGQRAGGRYDYVDGYTIKGLGFLSVDDRDHIRLASMLNLVPREVTGE